MLLRERELTLEKTIDICKAAEKATTHGKVYRTEPDTVHKVTEQKNKGLQSTRRPLREMRQDSFNRQEKQCKFCGFSHVMLKDTCPAWGKVGLCKNCNEKYHFAKKCRSKKHSSVNQSQGVHQLHGADSDSSEEWINSVDNSARKDPKDIKCEMLLGDERVIFQIDTGASVNVLPAQYASQVTPTTKTLTMWNGNRVSPLGTCRTTIKNPKNNKRYNVEFVVVKEEALTPLLGLAASQQMKLISVNDGNLNRVNKLTDISTNLCDQFADVFDGKLGTFPGEVQLHTDPSIHPVVMPMSRCPLAIRDKLKAELDRMEKLGVIAPVSEPTPWVSQIVTTVKKNSDLRVCIHPRELNKSLQREHYILPTFEDTLHELGQSR